MSIKVQTKKSNFETLSDRLLYALEELQISQAELARKIAVKPQAINWLCKSKVKKSQLTYEIADALNINAEWLANNTGFMRLEDDPEYKLINSQNRIPLITHEQIKLIYGKKPISIKKIKTATWLFTTAEMGENGFAIEIRDRAMYPRFYLGTLVFINPDRKPKDKEFVLSYIQSIDDLVFRQIEFQNEQIFLQPINKEMYKSISLKHNDFIIGTLVEARWNT